MKRILFFLIALNGSCILVNAQKKDTTAIDVIETKLKNISTAKEKLNDEIKVEGSATELFEEIKQLNDQIINLSVSSDKNSSNITAKEEEIKSLQKKLDRAVINESKVNELTQNLNNITKELEALRKYKTNTEAEQSKIDSLIGVNLQQYEDDIRFTITKFIGNIEGWSTLSGSLEGIAVTSASVLIFDEKTNQKIWRGLKKEGFDILTITSGVLSLNGFQTDAQEEGLAYAGLGIGLKSLQSSFKENKILESISRNVAFADEIRSYSKLSIPLDTIVQELYESIPKSDSEQKKWFPKRNDIDSYTKLIDLMDKIQLQNLLIKNKAEFLYETGSSDKTLSSDGIDFLEKIQKSMKKALNTWSSVKPIHQARIKTLYDNLDLREEEELGTL